MAELSVAEPPSSFPAGACNPQMEKLILITLVAVQFTSIVDFMVVMPLGPQLIKSLQITTEQFSLIVSSYTFAAGIAALGAASFLDRYDRKTAFVILYIGFVVGTLLCGLAPTYGWLLAARVLTGAFGGILGGQALTIVGDIFPDERRGRATAALMSGFAIASVLGVPAGIMLGNHYGWQTPFIVLAILSLPLLALAFYALPSMRGHMHHPRKNMARELKETLTIPNHLYAYGLISLLMMGAFSVIPFISAYYVANVGLTENQLPIIFISGGLVTLVGAPLIGRLVDRFGKARMFYIMAPLSALVALGITHLPSSVGIAGAAAATSLLMLFNTGRMVAAMALVTNCVEPRKRGGFMSANSSVQHIAGGLGTAIGGWIIDSEPGQLMQHYEKTGYFTLIVTLASLVMAWFLRPLQAPEKTTLARSLGAAAEAQADAGEPLASLDPPKN